MSTLTNAWNTQEVLDMIKWMRKYNETTDKKIEFTGCDMQSSWGALSHLSNFANHQNQTIKLLVDSLG
jgi:erythromycin esterase